MTNEEVTLWLEGELQQRPAPQPQDGGPLPYPPVDFNMVRTLVRTGEIEMYYNLIRRQA